MDIEKELEQGVERIPRVEQPQVANVLNYVYAIMGLVAVVVIVYNAISYLTSQGDPSKTKKATQGLIFAGIGLGVILLAFFITNVLFTTVGGAE